MFKIASDEEIEVKKQEVEQAVSNAENHLEFVKAVVNRVLNGEDISIFFPEIKKEDNDTIADFYIQENFRTSAIIMKESLNIASETNLREVLAANAYINSSVFSIQNAPSSFMLREYVLPMQNEAYDDVKAKAVASVLSSLYASDYIKNILLGNEPYANEQQWASLLRTAKEFNSKSKAYDNMDLQPLSAEEIEKIELMSKLETHKSSMKLTIAKLDQVLMAIKTSRMYGGDDYSEILPEDELQAAMKEIEAGLNLIKKDYLQLTGREKQTMVAMFLSPNMH